MTNLNRLSSMEKDRSSQQDKQSQNQAADFQRMISTLDDREKSIQGLAAEVAATKLAATGNASAEDLIQSAGQAATAVHFHVCHCSSLTIAGARYQSWRRRMR